MKRFDMALNYQQVIGSLNALKADDFYNEAEGLCKLYSITDELLQQSNPERAIPVLFAVMERMPDADLGSPGPLVHTLEKIKNYESELVASLHRAPCPLSVWIVNRILNATKNPEQRDAWLNLLNFVATNPAATLATKQQALEIIKYQRERNK
jgi:hypothetical protein